MNEDTLGCLDGGFGSNGSVGSVEEKEDGTTFATMI